MFPTDPGATLLAVLVGTVATAALILQILGTWFTFQKAGRPGWAAIVPFYNAYTYNKVGGKPGWWWVLWLIPIVNLIITLIVAIGIGRRFGKTTGWSTGLLWLLPPIGYMILGLEKGSTPTTSQPTGNNHLKALHPVTSHHSAGPSLSG
jgi:hypothetical protein